MSTYQAAEDIRDSQSKMQAEKLLATIGRMKRIPKAREAEQVAAGWPSWLAAEAGGAIAGWIPRRADSFEKLDLIGKGAYSSVYKARDLTNRKIVAVKKVRFDNLDPSNVRFTAREILVLRRLDHPNVIKLEGLITSRMSAILYLVFEYMEHDLAGLASLPGVKFEESQVKCYLQQLLRGLDYCHSRGVLHRDIKCSNILLDENGILKIADFGLASFFDPRQSQPLTSRVVTLWYRPPELLLGSTYYGVSVDLWSTGCILGELLLGRPIMPGKTEVEQLHKIYKLCGSPSEDFWKKSNLPLAHIFKPQAPYERCVAKAFGGHPYATIQLMETLLALDPANRGTAAEALESDYFKCAPFACDSSSLPKYPLSKEMDMERREGTGYDQRRRAPPAPNAFAKAVLTTKDVKALKGKGIEETEASNAVSTMLSGHDRLMEEIFQRGRNRRKQEIQENAQDATGKNTQKTVEITEQKAKLDQKIQELTSKITSFSISPTKFEEKVLEEYGPEILQLALNKSSSIITSPCDVDQLMREHDHQIRDADRRARLKNLRRVSGVS